jgi:hypothetical protein
MKYIFLKGNLAKKNYNDMSVTSGDKHPSYSTVKNWALKTGNKEHFVTPTHVTIPEKVDAIHSMILDHRRISARTIAQTLASFLYRVYYIIQEISNMRKPSVKCVPI